MKTILALLASSFVIVSPAFAGGEDPAPAEAPKETSKAADPTSTKEQILGTCLEKIGFTWVHDVKKYEDVRFEKPNHFYFGSKIWVSSGSDNGDGFKNCLRKVGAK